jgi:hypothetical protein
MIKDKPKIALILGAGKVLDMKALFLTIC